MAEVLMLQMDYVYLSKYMSVWLNVTINNKPQR
jgi:hypothetical protein